MDRSLDYRDYLSPRLSLMRDSLLCMENEAGTVGGYIKNSAHFKVARSARQFARYRRELRVVVVGWARLRQRAT